VKMKNDNMRTWKKLRWVVFVFLAYMLFPSPGKAEDEVLTLDLAIQMALTRNEQALTADQQVDVANAQVVRARAFFLPNITGTGTYTRRPFQVLRTIGSQQIAVQRYNAISGAIVLNLTIFDSQSIPALMQARSGRMAQQYASSESKRRLAFEVSNAFLSSLSVTQVLEAAKRRADFAKQALEAAKARYSAGLVSIHDVTRAELEYVTAQAAIIQAKGQADTTLIQLGNLLADTSAPKKTLKSPDFLLQAAEEKQIEEGSLIAEAQNRRLDLNSLRWTAKGQRALLIAPTLKWFPSLALTGRYTYTNESGLTGRPTNWNAGLVLTWNLFDGFNRNADYIEQRALTNISDLNVKAAQRQVDLDVRDALVSLANQRDSLKQATIADEVAKRNAAEITELYRQGLSTALEVADANVSLFEAEVELVTARYGLGIAYLNLEAALGLDPFGKEPQL
jgi:outer membrane protein TolC